MADMAKTEPDAASKTDNLTTGNAVPRWIGNLEPHISQLIGMLAARLNKKVMSNGS